MWAWQSSSSGAFFSLCPLTSWCLPPASGNIFIIIRGGPGLFDNIKTVLTSHLTWWRGINELNRDHEIQSEEKVEGPWMLMPMINNDACLNYETKNLPIRRKQKGLKTNKNWRICQTVIIFRRFFCSQVMVMVHAERSSWGWKVHTGMASTAWGKPLSWKIGLSDRRRAFLARACGVWSVECTLDDERWWLENWRCGDNSEWVNNPVQIPRGPGSDPGPGTLDCDPGPVCLLRRASGPGTTRRLPPIKGQWWLLIRDKSTWIVLKSRPKRWTLNQ